MPTSRQPVRSIQLPASSSAAPRGRRETRSSAGFSDVSGLGNEVNYSEYRKGNEQCNTVRKIPNTNKTDDVTFKRGIVGSDRHVRLVQERSATASTPRARSR